MRQRAQCVRDVEVHLRQVIHSLSSLRHHSPAAWQDYFEAPLGRLYDAERALSQLWAQLAHAEAQASGAKGGP